MDVPHERNHIHWFRKDLRLHDNPALLKSLENCDNFYGVYVLDTEAISRCKTKTSINVWRFVIQSLKCLDDKLRAFNSRLFVAKGPALRVLPTLFEQWKISRLTFSSDSEPYARQRDKVIVSLAKIAGVEVVVETSHTLFDVDRYIECNKGNIPVTFIEFKQVLSSLGMPPSPVESVESTHFESCVTPSSDWLDANFPLPTLLDFQFFDHSDRPSLLCGGEDEGLNLLNNFKQQILGAGVGSDEKFTPFSKSSKLSSYFRYGCLSVRLAYHELDQIYSKIDIFPAFNTSLAMRDFLFMLASQIPNWDRAEGNPLCLALPWDNNSNYVALLKQAKTGFPWIDAIVTQLKQEGWIHNEARQALACFLTRGCLWISWEEGVKFFEEYCIDAEWSLNAGGWLLASCSSFVNQYCRWYCPAQEGKLLDASGNYIRKYLPALRDFPNKYIYEPWKASLDVQKKANCIVGKDYPFRMVDHVEARRFSIEKLKEFHKELIIEAPNTGPKVIHWFKKDLRLHDNPGLMEAVRNGGSFHGVYVFDPLAFQEQTSSSNHGKFLLQCLQNLDAKLRECNSFLYVIRGSPAVEFRKLFLKWDITKLTMEEDTEPYGNKLEDSVVILAKQFDIQVVRKVSHTLYSIPQIVASNDGLQPFTFKVFVSTIKKIGQPPNPLPPLDSTIFHGCISPILPGYHMPTLEEFGLDQITYEEGGEIWKGGETEALRRFKLLEEQIENDTVSSASSTLQDITFPKVTALSPYMRFGCISPRLIYHTLVKLQKKVKNPQFTLNLLMKLLLRDFLFTLGHRNFFFDEVKKNPVCLKIPWESNCDFIGRWRAGTTGFPWIDAVMTQLRKEGWANHLGRQAAACFLTRGCLWVSWEEGFKACQEVQIDFEWSLCAANWLMISCSSFFVKSNKYYCPVNTGRKNDPQGIFVRKYIPALRNYPVKYIYDPWNAPLDVQKAAGCIIGVDYPMRIIDHEQAKLVCAARLKEMIGELREGISSSISLADDDEKHIKKKKKTSHGRDGTVELSI